MGRLNAHLIRAAEQAKRKFGINSKEHLKAELLVTESQERCKHSEVTEGVATTAIKTIAEGDTFQWCLLCARPLTVNGIPLDRLHPKRKH